MLCPASCIALYILHWTCGLWDERLSFIKMHLRVVRLVVASKPSLAHPLLDKRGNDCLKSVYTYVEVLLSVDTIFQKHFLGGNI